MDFNQNEHFSNTHDSSSKTSVNPMEVLMDYIKEAEQKISSKLLLLEKNQNCAQHRPDPEVLAKLDSSLKKNTAFVKKLRIFSAHQLNNLLKDFQNLNLSKYLTEVVTALTDVKLKYTDIHAATILCTEINCNYADFSDIYQEHWIKMLSLKKDEPILNSRKLSIDLCFYSELIICGLFSQHDSLPLLGTILVMLTSDKKFLNLNVIISFCKHCGYDFAGLVPKTTRILSDQYRIPVPRSKVLSAEKQENVKALFKNYYSSLNQHVLETLREMQIIEKQNKQILSLKGELPRDKMMKKELLHSVFQGLSAGANSLSELLDLPLPDLPETNCLEDSNSLLDADDVWQNIWEDEESRLFYTQFPDLKEYFPNGFNKQCADSKNSQNVETNPLDKLNKSKENSNKEIELLNKNEEQENSILNSSLETYLHHLPLCANKLMIDNAAIEFLLYYNSKLGRKRLLRTLFTVNRTRYDLLPLYGRLVSILNQAIPEIAHNLNQSLKTEVDRQIKKKDQVNIESKVRSVRFIGELVNQQVFSKYDVLQILKLLLEDFSHHHIEMACNLLDTCGRFLFRSMDSHHLTKKYLEQMMRVKSKTILDSRYVYMIESTYYLVNPPEVTPTKSLTKPSLHMFIEKIIFQDLMNFSSDTDVLKLLRSLNWDCEVTCAFTIQCLSSPHKLKYQRIDLLAELVAELMDYQEDIGFLVVDAVLEDIRFGMEVNLPIMNQRRISMIKYLGELYAYEVLENDVLFNVLYSLLTFGVSMDTEKPSSIDPPLNMFRIKLIITLLKTCCRYLIDDYSQQKLNCFFIYFQRYYWFKRSSLVLTKDLKSVAFLDETFLDAQFLMRIEFRLAKNYAEAVEAVKKLNKKLRFDILGSNEEYAILETLTEEIEEEESTEKEIKLFKATLLKSTKEKSDKREFIEDDVQFLKAFDQMIINNTTASNKTKQSNVDITIPIVQKKGLADTDANFILILKKGNKQHCKVLDIPCDSELISNLKTREEENRKEMEKVKQITLDINQRILEET